MLVSLLFKQNSEVSSSFYGSASHQLASGLRLKLWEVTDFGTCLSSLLLNWVLATYRETFHLNKIRLPGEGGG